MNAELLTDAQVAHQGGFNHPSRKFEIVYINNNHTECKKIIRSVGVIMGCGLIQISGFAFVEPEYIKEAKEVIEKIKTAYSSVNAFIHTLGQDYYRNHQFLLDLGFKQLAEYPNKLHGPNYTQRLYILQKD